jgi:hypothetical protein
MTSILIAILLSLSVISAALPNLPPSFSTNGTRLESENNEGVTESKKQLYSEFLTSLGEALPLDVSADFTGTYVVGSTYTPIVNNMIGKVDAFIKKSDLDGKPLWADQFGEADSISEIRAVATDPTGVYAAGFVRHDPTGSDQTLDDAFIRKYTRDGKLLWTDQIRSNNSDQAHDVTTDPTGVYVVGNTHGDLDSRHSGEVDVFIRKYDTNGKILWAEQFGTKDVDFTFGVAADSSGVYVVGGTITYPSLDGSIKWKSEAFIRKYTPDGKLMWTDQFGASAKATEARAVASDNSGIYVVGYHPNSVYAASTERKANEFIRKYDPGGNVLWHDQISSNHTQSIPLGVAAGSRGVFMVSQFSGSQGFGDSLRKYSADGTLLWTDDINLTENEQLALNIGAGAAGIYLIGVEQGESAGLSQAFVTHIPQGGIDLFMLIIALSIAVTTIVTVWMLRKK